MRYLAAATLLALGSLVVLPGCGAAAARPPVASTAPATAPAQLTVADAGRAVTLHTGEPIEVALAQQPGFGQWSHPTSTNAGVLAPRADPRAAAVRGMTLASFQATARGTADLQSGAGEECSPGVACPAIARGWQVHVVVV